MTNPLVLTAVIESDVVDVNVPPTPSVDITTADETLAVITVEGPMGPAGPAFEGTAFWFGQGPPTTIIGSKPGDYYVDTLTGTIYTLGG